jgi:hypothetical protein
LPLDRRRFLVARLSGPTGGVSEGTQDDGVHDVRGVRPIGLTVYGFDCRVSYGYPGGTDLMAIE